MFAFDLIAEQKIAAAVARGELSNLPGEGRPLDLDDDALIPEDLRMAYRILKNAGFVPPEVDGLREIGELEHFIHTLREGEPRNLALRKLQLLRARQEASFPRRGGMRLQPAYAQRILDRLGTRAHGN